MRIIDKTFLGSCDFAPEELLFQIDRMFSCPGASELRCLTESVLALGDRVHLWHRARDLRPRPPKDYDLLVAWATASIVVGLDGEPLVQGEVVADRRAIGAIGEPCGRVGVEGQRFRWMM
jgi:hypothetical protein